MKRVRPALGAFAALVLAGCGAITPSVTLPSAEPVKVAPEAGERPLPQRALSLDALKGEQARDQRVADVAFRIALANAELCPETAPLSGLTLHTLGQYSPAARALLAPGFAEPGPAVLAIAEGSPAAQAGLEANDVLVSLDGRPFPAKASSGAARYDDTAAAESALSAGLSIGAPAALVVDRGGTRRSFTFTPLKGCAYDAQVSPAAYRGASADGNHVFITDSMVDYASSQDDLAVVLGHEYAHDLLHHRLKIDAANPARRILGADPAAMRLAEREADYVGLYLAARAGYDIAIAPAFWARLGEDFTDNPFTHPGSAERTAGVVAALKEIDAKRASGRPLIPNLAGR